MPARAAASGGFPGNSNWTESSSSLGAWQTWSARKGDVARALMYMDVRYEGGVRTASRAWPNPTCGSPTT
jgi:hypothetical protein